MRRIPSVLSVWSVLAVWSALSAQSVPFQLTVDNIMRGPELVGTAPANVRFSADGRHVHFRWRAPGVDTLDQDYRVAVSGGAPERLPRRAVDTIPMAGVWSPDLRRMLVVLEHDLFVVERDGGKRRLTDTREEESAPSWSADGGTVFFRRGDNAWGMDLAGGRLAQLTDIRQGPAPATPRESEGQRRVLRDQQRELFDFVRRRVWAEELRADSDTTGPRPLTLGKGETVARLEVSPDGRFVLIAVSARAEDAHPVVMPVWVNESGYTETRQIRTKVGDAQARTRAGILEVTTGRVTWVEADSAWLNGTGDEGRGTRAADVTAVAVSPNGRHALFRVATTDHEDAWLVVVDLPSLARRAVAHLHDDAWLDGPLGQTAGWLRDGETVFYGSEATGWAHLYTVPAAGGTSRAVTAGAWEVQRAVLSPDGRAFRLHTNEGDFGQVHFWALDVASGRRTQGTVAEGRQDVVVSPDGRTLAVLHSSANRPPELYLQANRPGAEPRRVTESTTAEFRSYDWIVPEIVMIPTSDGVRVPARLYRPRGAPAHGAAVIFVHGAGYLQNVHKWWSSYYREYMFHHLLAARGYAVLDLDYRGSAGHGRDWRTAIYRHMGGRDLDDQVDAARWLVREMGVDSSRIGIYGGSYGGFITLMAMFTKPGVFAAGAALRPVTDWAHYNHGYTARILNTPQDDSTAFRRSSPIYHAAGLEGHLLICHGMVDDNVHFSDTVRLVQRLIELGKDNWEAAMYPVEPHGFLRADSWRDEYRRILRLFETALQ